MAKSAPIQSAINAGEFSPKLYGRTDIERYFSAGKKIENFIITPYGPLERLPGSEFIAETKTSSKASRLLEFEFSSSQSYIIEIGDAYMRFYRDGGQLVSGGAAYEIVSPYTESQLFDVHYVQTQDIVYMCHPDHPVKQLKRTADTTWTIENMSYTYPPLFPANGDSAVTINPSATTGNITLAGVGSPFDSDMVGGVLWIHSGYMTITSVTDANTAAATVVVDLTASTATDNWALGFSDYTGYPQALSFYQQRFFIGGAEYSPQTIWGSKPLTYTDFETGSDDDDGLSFTIAGNKRNQILWLSGTKVLNIGTTGATWALSSNSTAAAISPSDVNVTKEDNYGSTNIQPQQVGPYILFVTRNSRKIRELKYDWSSDAHIASESSIFSEHIPRKGVADISYQQEPYNVLWAILDTGEIGLFTRQIEQEVIGWSRVVTDGLYESVGIIPGDNEDEVWTIVKRTINGSVKRYVERFKAINFSAKSDMNFLQSSLTYSGTSVSIVSNLTHLEGESIYTVAYNSDKSKIYLESGTVSNASISLRNASEYIKVGLNYTSKFVQLNNDSGSTNGTSQGKRKRANKVYMRVRDTIGGKMGLEGETLDTIPFINGSTLTYTLTTGDVEVPFPGGWRDNLNIEVQQDLPLPMSILALFPRVETND